jgi:hypothetical protein
MTAMMTFEMIHKEIQRAHRRLIELHAMAAAFIADNRNARMSLRAQQAIAAFNPTTVKARMLDLLNEQPGRALKTSEIVTMLNEQPGHTPTNANAVRQAAFELVRDGFIIRPKHGVYRAVTDDDVEEVKF